MIARMASPSASDRLALLHQADWRFVLPPPPPGGYRHLALFGGPEGLAECLAETGLAERVTRGPTAAGAADLVVVLANAPIALADALPCLGAVGHFYCEVGTAPATPAGFGRTELARALETGGFGGVRPYIVLPDFQDWEVLVPAAAPGALRWYLDTLATTWTEEDEVRLARLRAAGGEDQEPVLDAAACIAVVAVRGELPAAAAGLLGPSGLPLRLRWSTLHPVVFADRGNRVTVMPFRRWGTAPVAVLKVPKLPAFNARTQNEQRTLLEIRARVNRSLRRAMAKPLGMFRHGQITVSMERYAPGRSMLASCGSRGPVEHKLDDLRVALAWLGDFHALAPVAQRSWGAEERRRWVEQPLVAYERAFGLTHGEARLFAAARHYAGGVEGASFVLVWQHRDYNVWNLFRRPDRLTVIDWEGGMAGPALCDALHFITHWNEVVRVLAEPSIRWRGFAELFRAEPEPDSIARAARRALVRYLARVRLDPALVPLLLTYLWVELAIRRALQRRDAEAADADPRAGNKAIGYVGVLADEAEDLFDRTAGLWVWSAAGADP